MRATVYQASPIKRHRRTKADIRRHISDEEFGRMRNVEEAERETILKLAKRLPRAS